MDINTLLEVERLLLYLEGKGKSENTRIAIMKNLKLISQRATLDNPQEVELTIARYTCVNGQSARNAYRDKLFDAYQHYCKFNQILCEKPICRPDEKGIQPPMEILQIKEITDTILYDYIMENDVLFSTKEIELIVELIKNKIME